MPFELTRQTLAQALTEVEMYGQMEAESSSLTGALYYPARE